MHSVTLCYALAEYQYFFSDCYTMFCTAQHLAKGALAYCLNGLVILSEKNDYRKVSFAGEGIVWQYPANVREILELSS